jgi:hypothetical protein
MENEKSKSNDHINAEVEKITVDAEISGKFQKNILSGIL